MQDSRENNRKLYILSFFIPFSVLLLIAVLLKTYPFGDNTVLISDIGNQYVSFYTFFKNIFTSNNNFFYTFSKTLGGDMAGFSAYYLQNPFLFLLLFIKPEYVGAAIYYIFALQLSLAGISFQIFLKKALNRGSLIFSTSYSLMGYTLAYFMVPIYFNNIILLPIVILGLYMIFDKKYKNGSLVYIISLALSIFFNYYIGYMLCLFSVMFFIYLAFTKYDDIKADGIIEAAKVYILSSISAVCLTLFNLLPAVLSLSGSKDAPNADSLKLFRSYKVFDSLAKLYTGAFDGNIHNTAKPYIYVGALPAFFAVYYILNRNVNIKKRIAALCFIISMIICLNIHTLNVIWHGFNEPIGFGYRFTFYLSFLLLLTGFLGFMSDADLRTGIISVLVVLAYSCYAFIKGLLDPKFIVFDIIIVLSAFIFKHLSLISGRLIHKSGNIFNAVLTTICILDLFINSYAAMNVNGFNPGGNATQLSEYVSTYERISGVINAVKENDKAFYRIEKDFQLNFQDPLVFDYPGLSHYSSAEKDYAKKFMQRMGFKNHGLWAFYNQGSTAFADMLLGVKYFISRFDSTDKPYETFANVGDDWIYKNNYALPLAFFANSEAINNVNLDTHNYFEIQNEIAKSFYFDDDIYVPADVESIMTDNLSCANPDLSDDEIKARLFENDVKEDIEFEKTDKNSPAYLEFTIKINEDNRNLYFFFDAMENQGGIRILVNDFDFDDYFTDWRFNIERAGQFKKGEAVSIKIALNEADRLLINHCYIYEEKIDALKGWSKAADDNGLKNIELNKVSSSHLNGIIKLPAPDFINNDVILSIPYDDGWHVTIDGYKINTYKTLDALLALDLSNLSDASAAGGYKINMYFIPKGIIIGSAVSILTLLALIFVYSGKKFIFNKR